MRLLVLTTVLPRARRTGGEMVTQTVVDALAGAGWEPTVVGYRRPGDESPLGPGEVAAGARPIETSSAGPRPAGWMAAAALTRSPYSIAKYRSRAYLRAAQEALRGRPDAVIVDHAQPHFALSALGDGAPPMIFLAHNAEGEMYARLAEQAAGALRSRLYAREARRIRPAEADLARRARQVWTLSEEDGEAIGALAPAADVRTLEVASGIEAQVGSPRCDVALIGTWGWRPNALGLEWFLDEVAPLLPDSMSVEVAGAGAGWLEGRRPNVFVRGPVDDAADFMARARVIAVPSVTGGGVQMKTLDAIATGVPVVATPTAVRGLGDLPPSVFVAEGGAAFADRLTALAADPGERPRPEALEWSQARRDRLASALADWTAEAAGRSPARLV